MVTGARLSRVSVGLSMAIGLAAVSLAAQPSPAKQKIASDADLPRFSYHLSQAPSTFVRSDDATFNAFAAAVLRDIDGLLKIYDIEDKATLRTLYGSELDLEIITGQDQAALSTLRTLQGLQEKPEARATSGFLSRPLIQARIETHAGSGPEFAAAYQRHLQVEVEPMDWRVVQDTIKHTKALAELISPNIIVADLKESMDPAASQSDGIDLASAESLTSSRIALQYLVPLKSQVVTVLSAFVAAHNVQKPDIWAARDVAFSATEKLTPVLIGIWDSGVDTSLFPDQLYTDPTPGAHSPHGLAYDMQGELYNGDLQPLTPEQRTLYPDVVGLFQGIDDLNNGIDSPEATKAREKFSSMPPDQLAPYLKQVGFLSQYTHGTHVAGIAVRGNPAARLVVAEFNDSLPDLPFPPSVAWATKFKAAFQEMGDYFRTNRVRVVNMSWDDNVPEIEQWLAKTTQEKDPGERKKLATAIYQVWRDAVESAIRSAPGTLFVCAAGNSDSNAGFSADVPASLHFSNLITVGAVDQAGEETSFTSYGDTVLVHADGFEVESVIPGGTRIKYSGTSMASPNVVNLAAKLIALDPSLTPEQTIALIRQGAETSPDGRRHIINPKGTVALLRARKVEASSR